MYNASLCYSLGEGLGQSDRLARKWMRKAADHGHSRAQYEHGLALLLVCNETRPSFALSWDCFYKVVKNMLISSFQAVGRAAWCTTLNSIY